MDLLTNAYTVCRLICVNVQRTANSKKILTNQNDNILIVKLEIGYCSYKIGQVDGTYPPSKS